MDLEEYRTLVLRQLSGAGADIAYEAGKRGVPARAVYIHGSILSRGRFREDSDVDVALVVDVEGPDGVHPKFTTAIAGRIMLGDAGALDAIVFNRTIPRQPRKQIWKAHRLASRVVTASLIKVPTQMLAEVEAWLRGAFARSVLEQVEGFIEKEVKRVDPSYASAETDNAKFLGDLLSQVKKPDVAKFMARVEKMAPRKSVSVKVLAPHRSKVVGGLGGIEVHKFAVRRSSYGLHFILWPERLGRIPWRSYPIISEADLAEKLTGYVKIWEKVHRAYKSQASESDPKKAQEMLRTDLETKLLKPLRAQPRVGQEPAKFLDLAQYTETTPGRDQLVRMKFGHPVGRTNAGSFDYPVTAGDSPTIQITPASWITKQFARHDVDRFFSGFDRNLESMISTVEHELRHYIQWAKSTEAFDYGAPPKRIKRPERMINEFRQYREERSRPEHSLRDIEYQTNIGNAVREVVQRTRKDPDKADAIIRQVLRGRPFDVMKRKDPTRWKAAVKTFFSELNRLGVRY